MTIADIIECGAKSRTIIITVAGRFAEVEAATLTRQPSQGEREGDQHKDGTTVLVAQDGGMLLCGLVCHWSTDSAVARARRGSEVFGLSSMSDMRQRAYTDEWSRVSRQGREDCRGAHSAARAAEHRLVSEAAEAEASGYTFDGWYIRRHMAWYQETAADRMAAAKRGPQ